MRERQDWWKVDVVTAQVGYVMGLFGKGTRFES